MQFKKTHSFSAAVLGLPKLLKEEDIHAEYPSDTDDEYVTEKGFQPTLPGEYTRLSSALALFRASRILARTLETIYPAATSHEVSLQQMSMLEAELDDWSEKLPQHLKLNFVADKPSTDITGSRSPLLVCPLFFFFFHFLVNISSRFCLVSPFVVLPHDLHPRSCTNGV